MNLRLFTIAVLISALPSLTLAETSSLSASIITLNKGDFVAAERISPNGQTTVSVKLSKSGKAKLKKLSAHAGTETVHAEIAGVSSNFTLREPIKSDHMVMGPYSDAEAQKVVSEINHQ
jgi:hypothetical protein